MDVLHIGNSRQAKAGLATPPQGYLPDGGERIGHQKVSLFKDYRLVSYLLDMSPELT